MEGIVASRTALIIDDDYAFAQFAKILLESCGIVSTITLDGDMGVAAAEAEHPDVIFMDIKMPGLNGIDAVRLLKSNPQTANIPIILCSMSNDPKEVEKALGAGAAQFLHKPLKREELQACLDKAFP